MTLVATVSDACAILARLELPLSERQVRYLALTPRVRVAGRNGGRLYDAEDVTVLAVFAALVRLCARWELPLWTARAAVRYREAEIRRVIGRHGAGALRLDPATGTATIVARADDRAGTVDLRPLATRVQAALTAHRAEYPEIWTGAAYVAREELTELAR